MKQIELQHISKSYDKKTKVIDDISIQIEQGEFFVLVGPSGCGKSTLLRMIAGLEEITEGVIKIQGQIANHMPPKNRKLSMVFQNYALYPHMTVKENILFGLDIQKVSKSEQEDRLSQVAAMIGLEAYLDKKPGQLSGGQRQRVALARSICSQSPICLMDEPLSNLDAKLRAQMRTEIRRIQKQLGLTIIYVTHDQVEAMTMGDRIMVLHQGKIQQIGSPLDLYNQPANQFVAGFIGSPQMNLLQAEVQGDEILLNGKLRVKMSVKDQQLIPEGTHFTVGIRGEDLPRALEKGDTVCPVTVVNTELMGNETQIVVDAGGQLITARWQGQWSIVPGTTLFMDFSPETYHFFDPAGGKNLRPSHPSKPQDQQQSAPGYARVG